ncbi:MAG TPA: ester cyclase [Steroidobacteraceae bacterium]|nr:ester cyclase [Steroidobacteraceae bacterium]
MRFILLALLLGSRIAQSAIPPPEDAARNLEVLKRYGEFGRQRDYAQQAALWSPGAINNGHAVTPDEIRGQLEDLYRTFPDLRSEAIETTAAGDLVIVLLRTSGTHKGVAQTEIYGGMLRGARPTGKRFEILRAHWWRLKDGRIVWHQVIADDLAMMRQLGLIPDTLPAENLVMPPKE